MIAPAGNSHAVVITADRAEHLAAAVTLALSAGRMSGAPRDALLELRDECRLLAEIVAMAAVDDP